MVKKSDIYITLSPLPRQLSLSSRSCPRPRPSSLPDVAPAASLGVDLRDRCQTNQHTTADVSLPTSAAAVVGIGRNLPWNSTVRPNAIRTSSRSISSVSQPNQSSEVWIFIYFSCSICWLAGFRSIRSLDHSIFDLKFGRNFGRSKLAFPVTFWG